MDETQTETLMLSEIMHSLNLSLIDRRCHVDRDDADAWRINIIELIIVIIGVVVIERIAMLTEPGWSFTGR